MNVSGQVATQDGSAGKTAAVGPPTGHPVLGPIGRHPWVFAALVGAVIGGSIALAARQAPLYRAETQYAIGGARVSNQELPGYITATNALAGITARLLDTTPVLDGIAKNTGLDVGVVRASVRATNIPDSPIVRIRAERPQEDQAKKLATSAGRTLSAALSDLERAGGQLPDRTMEQYRAAYRTYLEAEQQVQATTAAADAAQTRITEADPVTQAMRDELARQQSLIADAQLASAEAKASADSLRDLYTQQLRAAASGTGLQSVSEAVVSTDVAKSRRQLLLVTMIPLGIVLAGAFVKLLDARRRSPRPT